MVIIKWILNMFFGFIYLQILQLDARESVEILLQSNSSVYIDTTDKVQKTVLHIAAERGKLRNYVRYLFAFKHGKSNVQSKICELLRKD